MKKELERRNLSFEVRAEQTERGHILTGRPVVYNSRTDIGPFDEIICSGALDKTDLTDIRFLVNHDMKKLPLARSRRNNGNSTMQLSVDAQGLSLDWVDLDVENNADAAALYSAVQRGDVDGMSFAYSVTKERWENLESEHPTRYIEAIGSIVEISAVTWPAYEDTEINTRATRALDSARQAVETARNEARAKQSLDSDYIETLKIQTRILAGLHNQ